MSRLNVRRSWRISLTMIACFGVFPLVVGVTAAQQEAASIVGQVTDESGAVLPGATVTAVSPSLQVPELVSVTDERGEYRLTPLPIGIYQVTYALQGFETSRRSEIRLTVGFVAKVDVKLKVGSLSETVTVSGASPVVDVASSANSTHLTRETLENVPTSRNGLIGLMEQAPGVRTNLDVGGNTLNATTSFQSYGRYNDSWQSIEGVVTTSPRVSQSGNYWDYSTFEEAQIQTLGQDAEVPTPGIRVGAMLKSGGNDFHGTGFWGQTNHNFQSNNIDSGLIAQGITAGGGLETRRDVSADLGGRIVKDKLWFYAAARNRNDEVDDLGVFLPNGNQSTSDNLLRYLTGKGSYQMNASNKIISFMQFTNKRGTMGASPLVPADSRIHQNLHDWTGKVEWQAVRGNALVMSAQYGSWVWSTHREGLSGDVATLDRVTSKVTGNNTSGGEVPGEFRKNIHGALSWYKPDLFAGNHEFKTGADYYFTNEGRIFLNRNDPNTYISGINRGGNYQLIFNNGVPFQMVAFNYPVFPRNSGRYLGLYLQDTWTLARRLTLNLGVRYAHDSGFAAAQSYGGNEFFAAQDFPRIQLNVWNAVSPRLHASYDLTGDAKTVIKGGWGRYDRMRHADDVTLVNQNTQLGTTYTWHDLNGDKKYQPGEVNLDLNGSDFVSTNQSSAASPAGTAGARTVVNPNETEPWVNEYTLSVERQLFSNLAARITTIVLQTRNNYRLLNTLRPYSVYTIPVTRPDPGPDGVVGTTDDTGQSLTYYDYPASLRGIAFQKPTIVNDPKADADYKTIEIGASKRLADRWQLSVSYAATKQDVAIVPSIGGAGGFLSTVDPNAEIFSSDQTWQRTGKISGAYSLPYGVLASAQYRYFSGDPWARTVLVTGGQQVTSFSVRTEPIGTRYLPSLKILDLRVEKTFKLASTQSLGVKLNIYNAPNINTATAVNQQSGASFLRTTSIIPPRLLELSASYSF